MPLWCCAMSMASAEPEGNSELYLEGLHPHINERVLLVRAHAARFGLMRLSAAAHVAPLETVTPGCAGAYCHACAA